MRIRLVCASLKLSLWMARYLARERKHTKTLRLFRIIIYYYDCVCRFSRLIAPLSNRDFDLSMPLFQIYGTSSNGGKWQDYEYDQTCASTQSRLHAGSNTIGFPFHSPNTPQLTSARVNVLSVECPSAPVSVIWTHPRACTSCTFLSLHCFRFFMTGCQH